MPKMHRNIRLAARLRADPRGPGSFLTPAPLAANKGFLLLRGLLLRERGEGKGKEGRVKGWEGEGRRLVPPCIAPRSATDYYSAAPYSIIL